MLTPYERERRRCDRLAADTAKATKARDRAYRKVLAAWNRWRKTEADLIRFDRARASAVARLANLTRKQKKAAKANGIAAAAAGIAEAAAAADATQE
jgi:hypothetical protein